MSYHTNLFTLQLLKDAPLEDLEPADASAEETDLDPGRWWICRICGRPIARSLDRISVGGRHAHVEANPEGVVFHIGCFSQAPGCLPAGQRHDYWSWFPGHRWQAALCAGCGEHLGWFFSGESDFVGLIFDRIALKEEDA